MEMRMVILNPAKSAKCAIKLGPEHVIWTLVLMSATAHSNTFWFSLHLSSIILLVKQTVCTAILYRNNLFESV